MIWKRPMEASEGVRSCQLFRPECSEDGAMTTASELRMPGFVLVLAGVLFFFIGVMTWLNGPLVAFARIAFSLDDNDAFLIPSVFYAAHFFGALPLAVLADKIGSVRGMSLGLVLMAAGTACFAVSADFLAFGAALGSLFLLALGVTLLGLAINPYVALLGGLGTASRRIAVMGLFNKAAGVVAPLMFGATALRSLGALSASISAAPDSRIRDALRAGFAGQIVAPYVFLAVTLFLLAVVVNVAPLPQLSHPVPLTPAAKGGRIRCGRTLWLGTGCLFLYVGVEAIAGDAIGTYGDRLGLPPDSTKFFSSLTFVAMVAGYCGGMAFIPQVLSQRAYLASVCVLGMCLTVAASFSSGMKSVLFMGGLGFCDAMMWPILYPLAIRGLGERTLQGTAVAVMAVSGGAVLPKLFIWLASFLSFRVSFLTVVLPSYFLIFAYLVFCGRERDDLPVGKASSAARQREPEGGSGQATDVPGTELA
ncbi:glucose/galactose MFS transporter [Acetobacter sp. LMG 1636]|uniref:Glucose/galactose MFS transporter n=2 Tax=Acetobacter fallax TaxID=1737473 RepID=A0ABX0KBY7_9PROT|nr:glucose/galactose MFS transporter [Acetobacter fallax]NHO37484.1 glucose/galactose MFS transporter [Acetobacter fallax]